MNKQEMKELIDNSTYESLLNKWRFAPIGDVMFKGEIGDYYSQVMKKKNLEIGNDKAVSASKNVGWDRP